MTEDQLVMLKEVSILLGQMRKVAEQAAVIKTVYKYVETDSRLEKNDPLEKNDSAEKNRLLLKKILDELDIIQDVNIVSRTRVKRICKQLDPVVDM